METIRYFLIASMFVAIFIASCAALLTKRKIKKIKSKYYSNKVSTLQYQLKGKKPIEGLSKTDIDFIIKTIDINEYKTIDISSDLDEYTKKNIERINKIKFISKEADLNIRRVENTNNIENLILNLKNNAMLMIVLARKKNSFTRNILKKLEENKKNKWEYIVRGSGVIIILGNKKN